MAIDVNFDISPNNEMLKGVKYLRPASTKGA
ncbi:MAG: hypothetical protein QOJ05_854 [Verrucomicrobiota bacterium]|jgi:hypothetical protein